MSAPTHPWHAYLVRLGMEAYDRSRAGGTASGPIGEDALARRRAAFEEHLRERMAQAAQVIVMEMGGSASAGYKPKTPHAYASMLRLFRACATRAEFDAAVLHWTFTSPDEVAREDICHALKIVGAEKGWE